MPRHTQYIPAVQYMKNRKMVFHACIQYLNAINAIQNDGCNETRLDLMCRMCMIVLANYNHLRPDLNMERLPMAVSSKLAELISVLKKAPKGRSDTIWRFQSLLNMMNRRAARQTTEAATRIQRLWRAHMYNPDKCAAGMELARREFEACAKALKHAL